MPVTPSDALDGVTDSAAGRQRIIDARERPFCTRPIAGAPLRGPCGHQRARAGAQRGAPHPPDRRRDAGAELRRHDRAAVRRRALGGSHARDPARARQPGSTHQGAGQPEARHGERAERLPARGARRVRRADGRAHLLYRSLPGRRRASGCNAATPSGSAGRRFPVPSGAVSRTVAAALASWLGRGGSRKWSEDGDATRSASSTPACSVGCGGASACCRPAAGTSAGRSTRTPRWPRASCERAHAWSACPRWPVTTCRGTR